TMTDITRRDFLDGIALTIAAGLTPAAQGAAEPARYPPALTGLRGQHDGSIEAAHPSARQGASFQFDSGPREQRSDRGVVGSGISGRRAAFSCHRPPGPAVRILIPDTQNYFGAHAKRNEFTLDGRLIMGYGGSQSIDSPNTHWSETAKGLLRDLDVDVARFETAFERRLYSSLALARGLFLPRESFGRDVLLTGDPLLR